ncbi:polyprenol monophosphomannose synthase [Aquihabitans sp. G128]|uniref:polyprenol monophosphomannose synthase n=1 Tax=Aquihabitans sp. G128 TaxID=2849779 RepID=UPI0020B36C62|nr:polyprenol monophosphomannose synthase [Aquihabitans sp. G128]
MRSLVVVPTYQEADNVERFLAAVRAAAPAADLLVVDDNSPDRTGELAEKVGAELGRTTVLHRRAKDGLGAAYRHGFAWALAEGYDVIVQMDCDFSHDPAMVPDLVEAVVQGADCSIGSRYVPGGSTPNWPLHRQVLSRYGNRYTSSVLGLGLRDATSGFRAYRSSALERIDVATTRSNGYAFMSELAHRMVQADLKIVEVPITFVDRAEGTSKMSARIITESMAIVTANGIRARWDRRRATTSGGLSRSHTAAMATPARKHEATS